jgi:ribosomal protein L12E/L44/L45/RPP1/RPP2
MSKLHYKISVLQGEKIQTILKAANVNVESYWPGLFAKALEGVNVKELITNIGSGVGAAPAGAGSIYIILLVFNIVNLIEF